LSDELTQKSAIELAELIRARAVSPVEVIEAHLRRIEQVNPSLNAIVTLADDAIEQARTAEAALTQGGAIGPLCGLPLTVKDTIDTKALRTTSGSLLRSAHIPDRDAAVVAKLRAAGAIILGKTNTPEMAIPYETNNSVFGRSNNPYNLQRTSGGSSGGEAAAIAACLSPAGVGSDLSGSIRVPAHFCGIVGLKPTTGRVPMDGHTPAATGPISLGACIGSMARTVGDVALLFNVIADATQYELSDSHASAEPKQLRGVRVAWYADDGVAPLAEDGRVAVEAAAKALTEAGFEVNEARPRAVIHGSRLWTELFSRAAANQLLELYRGREDRAGPLVAAALQAAEEKDSDMATKIKHAEELAAALVERERRREELLRWMKTMPLILAPVGAVPAFSHGARRVNVDEESISIFRAFSYSQTFNVFGLPSISVPAGCFAEGLPIGVQVVGRPFEERTVLGAAAVIERALGGWRKPPQF